MIQHRDSQHRESGFKPLQHRDSQHRDSPPKESRFKPPLPYRDSQHRDSGFKLQHRDSQHRDSTHRDSQHRDSGSKHLLHRDSQHRDSGSKHLLHRDSQYRDSQHRDSGSKRLLHRDSQHRDSQHRDSQHRDSGFKSLQHRDSQHRDSQPRDSGFKPIPLQLSALNSINSVQSVHSVNIVGGTPLHGPAIDMGICRGDKELGPSDYFARNLFVNQYDEDEEEIVCARAHTRCKVLKIARDDFVLIMASQQSGSGDEYLLFHDNGVVGNGILPDNQVWKNKINNVELDDLEEKDVLGIGSFGKVTLVQHKKTGATYALKAVSKYRVFRTGQEEHIINEKRVLTMLDSPFCVKLFATFKTETTIDFSLRLC